MDTPRALVCGFAAGATAAAVAGLALWPRKQKNGPTKQSHPREWAIFQRLDQKRLGAVTRDDVRALCYRFESDEHAELLAEVLDPEGRNQITFQDFCQGFEHVQCMRQAARLKLWHRCCGIGVAGNVAGHMAQAGEANPSEPPHNKPAAIFAYYMPQGPFTVSDEHAQRKRLQHFPVTYAVIEYPKLPGASNVQVEPELGLYVDIVYSQDGSRVERLVPRRVAAFNDCSIRSLEGANKLSMKKNWGHASKGISIRSFEIDSFSKGSFVDSLVLVSYVKRNEQIYQYSVTAPARNYLLFHDALLEWIVEQMNEQANTDKWEEILPLLKESDYPTSSWIALGAGEYTEWGAANFLQARDEALVIVYDERVWPKGPGSVTIDRLFDDLLAPEGLVSLHQTFL